MNQRLANIPAVLGLDKRGTPPENGKAEKLDPLPGEEKQTDEQKAAFEAQQKTLVNPKDRKDLLDVDPEIIVVDRNKINERRKAEGKEELPAEDEDTVIEDIDLGIPEDILPDELKVKKEVKKEEPKADDISDEVIGKWEPKAQEAFKAMRIELKQAKEAIKAKGEGKATPEQEERLVEAQKALAEAHNTIARLNLAEDPRFKAKYSQQKDMITAQLKHQAKQLEYDEGIVDILKNLGLRERISYINEKAPMLKDVSMPLFTQLDMIDSAMQSELANAKASMQQISTIQTEQIKALQGKVLSESVDQATKAGHFVFKKGDNAEWNTTVDTLTKKANDVLTSGNFKLQTESIILGQAAPIYLDLFKRERAARMKVQQQLSKFTNGKTRIENPNDDGGDNKTAVPRNVKLDDIPKLMEAKRRQRAMAQ